MVAVVKIPGIGARNVLILPLVNYIIFLNDTTCCRNLQKWLPYQILGVKTVKNVQINPQTTGIWSTDLLITLSVS